jgi:hypothetical protein
MLGSAIRAFIIVPIGLATVVRREERLWPSETIGAVTLVEMVDVSIAGS